MEPVVTDLPARLETSSRIFFAYAERFKIPDWRALRAISDSSIISLTTAATVFIRYYYPAI